MKRILSFVLVLVMCLSLLAACGEPAETTAAPAGGSVEDAKDYLAAMYKDTDGTVARRDFSVVAVVMIDGVSYPVTWTTDAPDFVTIGAAQNNMVTIDIVEEPAEQVTFKLTGTVTDKDGKTASATFTRIIEAKKVTGIEFVKAPEVGTAYKFALQQNNLGKTLFFTGAMSGNYLAMSENPFEAVDVFVEDVEGGQRIYFMAGEVKTYVDVVPRGADNPGKVNVVLTEAPTCVFTWDADRKTFTTTVDGNNWYLGTYNTYNTISASNTSYIENLEVIGATQFPAGFATVNIVAEQVKEPAADTAYKFAVQQNNLGQTLYFTGEMNGFYLATSVNPAEGVNVFVENVEGGARLYFMKGETKTYIDIVPRGADNPGKVNVVLTEAPTCVFTWDADRKTFTTTVEGNNWYLGCYNTYNTISASNTSYIENLEVIGATQFPAGPHTVEGFMDKEPVFEPEQPVEPEKPAAQLPNVKEPAEGTAYKFGVIQVTAGKTLYITGEVDGRYLVTTADKAAAADVYVEKVDGGYKFYILVDGAKSYIVVYNNADGKRSVGFDAEGSVFTYKAEISTWATTFDGKECYVGAYNAFETLSVSDTSYINAENAGISQFPSGFFA